MEASSSSVRVFDGTTDFRVWRARVENELMRYHLLGYVMVQGYDGSQSFTFNGEQVPPRFPVIHVDEEAQQSSNLVKEEAPSCGRQVDKQQQQGRLSRWDVLGESAEAKSILQRFLHPDVECAILNKNIYDSWTMLCALYGNRSSPGAHDVHEMHRVLHHIRLGDKKGEPVREFITRWEMLMQQYALATGIELTDGFRSVSLVQTLPSAWRPMVTSWRGVRPFVPYPELVEKVIITRERMLAQTETANGPVSTVAKPPSSLSSSAVDTQVRLSPEKSVEKPASVKPVTQSATKPTEITNALAEKPVSKPAEKPTEKRAAEAPTATETATKSSKPVPPAIDVRTEASNTVDLTNGDLSTTSPSVSAKASTDRTKKSQAERSDKASTPRTSKRNRDESDGYDKRDTYSKYSKYDAPRGYSKYASSNWYDKSSRNPRSRYEKTYEHDSFETNKNGPVSCFYCLKVGHHMKRCWYLKADIENGTTHDMHKKFSCAVTIDRNEYMVKCLEAYIDEENRTRASYGASTSTPRSHRDYEVADSVGRNYNPQHQEFVQPSNPPAYGFRSDQPSASGSSAPDYHKRSHSVFQMAEGRVSSRDPRLNRSRSVYRFTDVAEDFSPRKRPRAPSFERQLQGYY